MGVFRRQWPGVLRPGEDWHYVGEAGEPAFQNSWDNAGGGEVSMAFRIRGAAPSTSRAWSTGRPPP